MFINQKVEIRGNFFGTSNEFALFYAKNKSFANFNRVILDDNLRATYDRKDEHGIFKPNNYLREGGGDCNLRKNKPNFGILFMCHQI